MTLWINVSRLACCEFLCLPVARLLDASRLACCELLCLPVAPLFGVAMAPRTRMTQRVDELRRAGKSPLDAPERQKVGASFGGEVVLPVQGKRNVTAGVACRNHGIYTPWAGSTRWVSRPSTS